MSSPIGLLIMKKPRVKDFDPNAAPELGSPMDDMPSIQKPVKGVAKTFVVPIDARNIGKSIKTLANQLTEEVAQEKKEQKLENSTEVRPSVRPYSRTGNKRTITRYAFEFYQDQIDTLRKFSLDEKLHGEKGSMSEMVREALDMFIAKRNRTEE